MRNAKKTSKYDKGLRKKRSLNFIEKQKIKEEERAQTKFEGLVNAREGLVNTRDKEFEKTVEEAVKSEEKIGIEGLENTDEK